MITYFELVTKIEELSSGNRNEETLSFINNAKISLHNDRYFRTIDHLSYAIEERLKNAFDNIMEKIKLGSLTFDIFTLEFNELLTEIDFCRKIANTPLIDNENKNELETSLNKSVNNILNVLIDYFSDLEVKEEFILMIKGGLK